MSKVCHSQIAVLALCLLALGSVSAPATASVPRTPPELRDFRLDPERAPPREEGPSDPNQPAPAPPRTIRTAPVPTPTPTPRSAPVERNQPAQRAEPTPRSLNGAPQPSTTRAPSPEADRPPPVVIAPPAGDTPAEELSDAPELDSEAFADSIEREQAAENAEPVGFSWWPWLLALLVAAGGALLLWYRRRSRTARAKRVSVTLELPQTQPASEPDNSPLPAVEERTPSQTNEPIPVYRASRPWIDVAFDPLSASQTLTALVVRYRLTLTNSGEAAAETINVHGGLLPAGAGSDEALTDWFDRSHESVDEQTVGPLASGGKRVIEAELRLPLAQAQSFTVNERRLLVPLAAIDLHYHWGEREGRSSCAFVIGREAEPPKPKMAPLRVDLGPRTFARIGGRPSHDPVRT